MLQCCFGGTATKQPFVVQVFVFMAFENYRWVTLDSWHHDPVEAVSDWIVQKIEARAMDGLAK